MGNDWDHGNDYDLRNDNDSMYLYGNGFYKTSTAFDSKLKDTNEYIKHQWISCGDEISVKINTKTKDVIIWNSSTIDIQKLHSDEMNFVFFMKVPIAKDLDVAMMIDMGFQKQIIHVVDQKIEFIE